MIAGILLLLGGTASTVALAGPGPAQPGTPAPAPATGHGEVTLIGEGVPSGNLQTDPFVKPFIPVGLDAAAYRSAKSATTSATAPHRRASVGALPMIPPVVRGANTNQNGTNFANSAGTGANCNCAPPDVDVAVGPSNVVETVNSTVAVYSKGSSTSAPALQKRTSLRSFFGAGATERIADPRVVYDFIWNRWIIVMTRVSASTTDTVHRFFLAVSKTSNPTGSFFIYSVGFNLGPTPAGDWLDFPGLGFDQDAIAVTGVIFDTPTGGFKGSAVIGIAKARAYNGLGFTFNFPAFQTGVIQPTVVLDQSAQMFLTASRSDTDAIDMFVCTELEKPAATDCHANGSISLGFDLVVPPAAPAQGSTVNLDTLDTRFENRGYQFGTSVWQVHTIGETSGGTLLATPRFYQVNTSANTIVQQGDFFTSGTSDDYNASIAANELGEAFVTWNTSTSTSFVQARFSGRQPADPAGSMNAPGTAYFTSANGYTFTTIGEPPRRWGDYSGTALDPQSYSSSCGAHRRAWVANEKVETNGTWGSRFVRIGPC